MPQAIAYIAEIAADIGGYAADAAEAIGLSEGAQLTIGTLVATAAQAGIYAGATAALNAATQPKLPGPESTKQPLNQARPPVRWGSGMARLSGPRALWDNVPGWSVEVNMLFEGPCPGFGQVYLNDDKVTIKDNHFVATGTDNRYNLDLVQVYPVSGTATGVATPAIVALSGDKWTNNDRLDGITHLDMAFRSGKVDDISTTLPNGPPQVSVVAKLPPPYDWRDETQDINDPSTWKWTPNAVVNHITWEWFGRNLSLASEDYVAPNAAQLGCWAREFEPAIAFWTTAADIADEIVAKKGGGEEARYTVSLVTFLATDDEATVRQKYLDAYDGWMIRRSDGAWVVRAGKYVTPTFEVTDANFVGLQWKNGTDDSTYCNVLQGSYVSPTHDWTSQDIDPWVDPVSESEGEIVDTHDLVQVPSHSQARRLLKREMYRRQAEYQGVLTLDLTGLQIGDEGHRWLRLALALGPASLNNVIVEIDASGNELVIDWSTLTVSVPVRSSGANIDEWDPDLEEGFEPDETDRTIPDIIPAPEILDAFAEFQSDTAALIVVKIADPDDDTRLYQLSWWDTTINAVIDGPWSEATPVTGGLELRTGALGLGIYDVVVRANVAGRVTDWSNPPQEVHIDEGDAPYIPPRYDDGTDINTLKPAEGGADKTSTHTSNNTSNVGTMTATGLVAATEANALQALQSFMTALGVQDQLRGLMFNVNGKNVQLIAIDAKNKADNAQSTLTLIGAANEDGSAFVLNGSGVKIGDQTLAEYVSGVQSSLDGHTSSISEQATAINGLLANWQLTVNNDTGAISGIFLSAVGSVGHTDFVSGVFRFVTTSTSGDPLTPMIISGDKVIFTGDAEFDGAVLLPESVTNAAFATNAAMVPKIANNATNRACGSDTLHKDFTLTKTTTVIVFATIVFAADTGHADDTTMVVKVDGTTKRTARNNTGFLASIDEEVGFSINLDAGDHTITIDTTADSRVTVDDSEIIILLFPGTEFV